MNGSSAYALNGSSNFSCGSSLGLTSDEIRIQTMPWLLRWFVPGYRFL